MADDLDGKVAVVTGAASGIGEAIARAFLDGGARVVAVDLAEGDLDDSERLRWVLGDVAAEATATAYARTAVDAFGRVDVMVNNAAILLVKKVADTTPEEWDRVMAVNVRSIYWSARALIPLMKAAGGGLFLNTGSISAMVGIPDQGVYAASKGAVVQLTRQMAVDYAPDGIRVVAVCPGTVDTPLLRRGAAQSGDADQFLASFADAHPIGRIASSEEIAEFYRFLASDRAGFFTGSVLMIDGGFTAR